MIKKYLIVIVCLFLTLVGYSQITKQQLAGTWALAALNASDDPTLVIVYQNDFKAGLFFTDHAINKVWEIRDTNKLKYKTEFSKMQLTDEMVLGYLDQQKNLFYQFSLDSLFKENNASDSLYSKEKLQDAAYFETISNKKIPGYKLSGDTLFITNPMQGNSGLTGYFQVKLNKGYLILEDSFGTSWYFSQISNKPKFSFEPKLSD